MAYSSQQDGGCGAVADPCLAGPQAEAREFAEVAPPASRSSRPDNLPRRLCRLMQAVSIWHFAALGGVFLLLSWSAGVVLWLAGANGDGGKVPPPLTASRLEELGYTPALATKPWDPATTQWTMGAATAAFFALRKYAFPSLTRRLYGELPVEKQVKIANYMLELLGTSLALIVSLASGLWDVLFFPDEYMPIPDPEQAYSIAWGLQLLPVFFVPMYILELAFDEQIRAGLALHHWLSVVLVLWGCIVEYQTRHDMATVRLYVALSLYMTTEQNVFVEMLAYYLNIYWPCLFSLSAWYYLVSRVGVMVLCMYTWWECRNTVFVDGDQNSTIVYSLWLFIPAANVILNATQMTTVTSLFGIARTVRKRAREQAAAVQPPLQSSQWSASPAEPSSGPALPPVLPALLTAHSRRTSRAGTCKSLRSCRSHKSLTDDIEAVTPLAIAGPDHSMGSSGAAALPALLTSHSRRTSRAGTCKSLRSCRSHKSLTDDDIEAMTPLAMTGPDDGMASSGAEAAPNPAQVLRDAAAAIQLHSQFQGAQAAMKSLGHVSDKDKLRLYALYKQALHGPARPSEKPGMFQVVARAKWEAWARLEDMEASIAKQEYVEVANELMPGWQECA